MARHDTTSRRARCLLIAAIGSGTVQFSAEACDLTLLAGGPFTIQGAIGAALSGQTICLGDGVWSGPGNYDLDLTGKTLSIRSLSGNAANCIINCGSAGRAITFDAADANSTLKDITILNGVAGEGGGILIGLFATPTLDNVRVIGCYASGSGGGVRIWEGAVPTIVDCEVANNWCGDEGGGLAIGSVGAMTIASTAIVNNMAMTDGGGVSLFQGTGGQPNVTFEDCVLQGNEAGGSGGGVSAASCTVTFQDCQVYQNDAAENGGGLALTDSSSDIRESSFRWNEASLEAGAVHHSGSHSDVRRGLFLQNVATNSSAVRFEDASSGRYDNCRFLGNDGGSAVGMFDGSDVAMANALFSGNDCTFVGAGAYVGPSSHLLLTSSTLSHNHTDATSSGGVYVSSTGTAAIHNCIAWGNEDASGNTNSDDQIGGPGFVNLDWSCVQNLDMTLYVGSGNNASDPLFVDYDGSDGLVGDENDNCRLATGSTSIDSGNNAMRLLDVLDLDGVPAMPQFIPLDLDDTDRVKNGTIDRGAYEHCAGDTNSDGAVDVIDLNAVILDWGTSGAAHNGDVNDDGIVDVSDLTEIVLHWGAC